MNTPDPLKEEIIYSFYQIRPNAQVRVFSSPWAGKIKVHMREYYRQDETQEYKVGRGMAIDLEALEEVIKGFFLAGETLKGYID